MKILKIYPENINDRFIAEAIDTLNDGEAIIYPTDSLYAIGCDATSQRAIERVCRIKGIDPQRQHLAIMCAGLSQAARYARIDNRAFDIMRRHLPGPFTFILPAASTLPKIFKGRKEVGIRISSDPVAQRLALEFGRPLLTTTLMLDGSDAEADFSENNTEIGNGSGYGSKTSYYDPQDENAHLATIEIADRYNATIPLMIDSGSRGTLPSTVIDLTDSSTPTILRQGIAPFNE